MVSCPMVHLSRGFISATVFKILITFCCRKVRRHRTLTNLNPRISEPGIWTFRPLSSRFGRGRFSHWSIRPLDISALAHFGPGTGKMRVANFETASGYFASWSASKHAIWSAFLKQLAVYPVQTHSRTTWIFVPETTRHAYPHTQHVCMPSYILITWLISWWLITLQ